MIPVVDLFAGPGGLSEGFASVTEHGRRVFQLALGVESDPHAMATWTLRAFYHTFPPMDIHGDYYRHLRGELSLGELYERFSCEASKAISASMHTSIGNGANSTPLDERIMQATRDSSTWILIGGPPCQAYSPVGKARQRKNPTWRQEDDKRFKLYSEFLRVVAKHRPSAFVLENVRGILNANADGKPIMRDILRACSHPRGTGLKYRLFAILLGESDYNSPESFMVKAERLGLPQARHRLIVTGIREDMKTVLLPLSENGDSVGIEAVLSGLLPIRSGLTHHEDSFEKWIEIISGALNSQWIDEAEIALPGIKDEITKSIEKAQKKVLHAGCDFISCKAGVDWKPGWILDPRIGGVCQHQAKSHMDMDLHRYLFASCVARLRPCSPRLDLFPEDLLPKHKNVRSGKFKDRFRVQREGEPCRTITSHLAADGHAHIHPDPSQCRSLSLREAARVQTFRDNHLLLGNRTQRYTQVGNAVPPYLAYLVACQLAEALGHRPDLIKD